MTALLKPEVEINSGLRMLTVLSFKQTFEVVLDCFENTSNNVGVGDKCRWDWGLMYAESPCAKDIIMEI